MLAEFVADQRSLWIESFSRDYNLSEEQVWAIEKPSGPSQGHGLRNLQFLHPP